MSVKIMDAYKKFLIIHKTAEIQHPTGGSLFEHLYRVYELLKKWGNPNAVCLAGLFHSVYGTNSFPTETLSLEKRPEVQKTIGKEAEYYVYLFCAISRKNLYPSTNLLTYGKIDTFDRFKNKSVELSLKDYKSIAEIQLSNIIDYVEHCKNIDKYYLFEVVHFLTQCKPFLSSLGYEKFLKRFKLEY